LSHNYSSKNYEDRHLSFPEPYFIGIAGPSSAGKSTIAQKIVQTLPDGEAITVGMDSYYLSLPEFHMHDLDKWNFDRPEAFDKELMFKQILALSHGKTIEKPCYNYRRHSREQQGVMVNPAKYILVEGLYTLYWHELRGLYLTSAFITAHQTVCRSRKMHRDLTDRNLTPEYSIEQYESFVLPMYEKHIHPTRIYADIIIDGERKVEDSANLIIQRINEVLAR